MKFEIFDSTLRDGSQGEGISFSLQDKLNIVRSLDDFGVDYIEAGNPASNPKEMKFFERIKNVKLKNAKITAFGSTIRYGNKPEDDAGLSSLLAAGTDTVAVFGKSWILHVTEILKIRPQDNIEIVRDTIAYIKAAGREVIFDAEHFFDGCKNDEEYAMSVLAAAVDAGADCLCLCDTNGGCLPGEIADIVTRVRGRFPETKIGIHCHDDSGCAVANSLTAVQNGATQVQGTFIGIGERCGNANLSAIIPDLILKCGCESEIDLTRLKSTARAIADTANVRLTKSLPYVGKSAFSHKGGMHIDGVMKLSQSFEHVDPESVGNERKFLLSEVSGRNTVLPMLRRYMPDAEKNSPETAAITQALKERELYGYHYEAAEASFELFIKKQLGQHISPFRIIMYKVTDDFPAPDGEQQSNAMVKIEVDGKTEMTCASGNGPVNALDSALRRGLRMFYPQIDRMHLIDYKVRVIDSKNTDAFTRVLIESDGKKGTFSTIGVSSDIIEASFTALIDSFEYELQ